MLSSLIEFLSLRTVTFRKPRVQCGYRRLECFTLYVYFFRQRPSPIRPQAVAGVLRPDLRRLHETLEVPAAAPPDPGHQVRTEEVADRGDRLQNRPALLPLLVRYLLLNEIRFSY